MVFIIEGAEKELLLSLDEIKNDSFYWRSVFCMPKDKEFSNPEFIKKQLSNYFSEKEVRVFFFKNTNFVILVKGGKKEELLSLQRDLTSLDEGGHLYVYDLSAEWLGFAKIAKKLYSDYLKDEMEQKKKKEKLEKLKHKINFEIPAEDVSLYLGQREKREGTHILLVDDEPMTLRMISNALSGYTIYTATDSQDALNDYMTYAPDVVFLDINMPISNGHEILKKITAFDNNSFVVMLSANSYPDDIKKAMSNGAKGFVSKPFSKEKLLQYIRNFQDGALPGKKIIKNKV